MNKPINLGRGGTLGNLKGQAGVYAVASRLCLLGQVPYFPGVDHGVDLMIANGLRLQIKVACLTYPQCGRSSRNRTGNYLGGAYGFNLRRGVWEKDGNRMSRTESRDYRDVADFFVLWGMDENRFWIVPTSIKNRVIWFGRAEHPNGSNNASYTSALRKSRCEQYEDRWDLLDLDSSAKQIVESVAPAFVLTDSGE